MLVQRVAEAFEHQRRDAFLLVRVGLGRRQVEVGDGGREPDISLARVRSREDAHGVAAAGGCRGVGSRSTCL